MTRITDNRIVELCKLSIGAINEDIKKMEDGELDWLSEIERNISRKQLSRMKAVVSHLQEIVDGLRG